MRGWWSALRDLVAIPSVPATMLSADTGPDADEVARPLDQVIETMMRRNPGRVTRDEALSVSAVLRGRNLIASIATLPLVQYRPDWRPERSPLLEQIDPDVANVVTIAQTVEDLLFEGISWWLVVKQDGQGYPTSARHLSTTSVSLRPPAEPRPAPLPSGEEPRGAVVYVDGREVPASKIIRFDSPNPGLLKAASRPIRRAILLDRAAAMYAEDPRPSDYFTPNEMADPVDDDEVEAILRKWVDARRRRATGYVPAALKYNTVDTPSPADLQLEELQRRASLELANALGLDPEDLGISTTSRTYQNATDRRQDRVNDVLSPYMRAITDRLSMGDVTRRGHLVRFDLDDYMRADPRTRWDVYEKQQQMGATTVEEIRDAERKPPLPAAITPAPAPAGAKQSQGPALSLDELLAQVLESGAPTRSTFAAATTEGAGAGAAMVFGGLDFADGVEPAKVDVESRTITGLAVPYNKIARKYGLAFRFLPGSLQYADVGRIKHLKDHYVPVGVTASVEETRRGPVVKLRVLDGPEGSPAKVERDQLLYDAKEGLYDGLSVGVDFSLDAKSGDVEWNEKDQVYDVKRATWRETSSTPLPAFDDARVTKVRAAREGGITMPCNRCGQVHAEGVACTAPTPPPAATPVTGAELSTTTPAATPPAGQPQPAGLTFTAEQVTALLSHPGGLAALLGQHAAPAPAQPPAAVAEGPAEQRPTVDPTRLTASTEVHESAPYRFDTRGNIQRGSHDFSSDLIAGLRDGDQAAYDRALAAVRERFDIGRLGQFDTDRADTAGLNPTRQRPDLYVDQRSYHYPIWEAINKGTLTDITPFVFPKFNSASGLVANHTEGVEPTPGTFTVTTQTVTPTAISGKAEITREVWDQGGNPQVSGLIWRQMEKGWYEALEAAAVAALDAVSPTGISLTAGVKDGVLDGEITSALALLQFVRGGFTMDNLFTQVDLYKALVAAVDDAGRRLYPAIGPSNSTGQARARWAALDLNGITAFPAWALAASGAVVASSYLFDSESVHGWASAPNRLSFEYQVKSIDVAIWGYRATAVSDLAGVREITYDPVA
ncbi:phage portal protein [Micromonospora sp. NPDC002296]|uniref:phage portal protein n=1 Tax=Micromonospora sp. NPDC002296 TaxID=3154271 RepID=UPI00331C1339